VKHAKCKDCGSRRVETIVIEFQRISTCNCGWDKRFTVRESDVIIDDAPDNSRECRKIKNKLRRTVKRLHELNHELDKQKMIEIQAEVNQSKNKYQKGYE